MSTPIVTTARSTPAETARPARAEMLAAILLYWCLVAAFQYWSGTSHETFGGYPDESSHYLSGLLVRDFLLNGPRTSPLAFAVNYYTHMPFFAVGYWPPLFYGIEGAWMLVFGYQRSAVLLLPALVAALLSSTIFRLLTPYVGRVTAFLFGLFFLLTPAAQWSNRLIMVDTTFTLFSFWAGLAFASWARTKSPSTALLTGLLGAAALLTKVNSVYLFLLPGSFFLVSKRWPLLRQPSFWIMPATLAGIWGPWYLLTRDLASIGFGGLIHEAVIPLVAELGRGLWQNMGWFAPLVLLGAFDVFRHQRSDYRLLICALLPICYTLFLIAARVSIEGRFLLPILVPSIVLAGIGLNRLASKYARPPLSAHRLRILITAAGIAAFPGFAGLQRNSQAANPVRPTVDFLCRRAGPQIVSILVPSNAEGPFIAEFAMHDQRRLNRLLVRPLKLLFRVDWNGSSYQPLFHTADELLKLLDQFPVQYIIVAAEPCRNCYPEDALLRDTLRTHPERWTRISAPGDNWVIYQRSDGKQLAAAALEDVARHVLGPRLASLSRIRFLRH